ncbi:hypothetical protein E4U42_004850 [Claviceps africana]|uniref:DNA replication regulator Sld3 C-terminal domain-containing protein n=1 Tax=Claviceps africana TaxID=83212 RepID=A0A8K0J4E1_9HYPO|nr:hypothetical protein E4U42_004850 [Claviceps africana]
MPAAALGADASRPRPGILTPSSDGSLNRRRGSIVAWGEGERHGKREGAAAMDHLLDASITVRPHPPDIQARPRSLSPLMLLPRQHLSLASLDSSSPPNGFPRTRFVESHVKILDLESRLGSHPAVVIARSDSQGFVFALERQDNGLYVMCKLGPWVDLDGLARSATALCRSRLASLATRKKPQEPDLEAALTTPHMYGEQKRKRAAIEAIQSLVRKKSKAQPTLEGDVSNLQGSDGSVLDSQTSLQLPTPGAEAEAEADAAEAVSNAHCRQEEVPASSQQQQQQQQQTAEMIFNNIRTHYSEALYKSMGSLAYFAKGPLSRARSAFHLDLESNLDMQDLIDFLKSLILTTVQIDKKYRETIPDVIGKMKAFPDSSDDGGKKRRKPRKIRLGKNALYPLEDESICKWWNANKPEPTGDSMAISPSQLKSHVAMLRTRETQLQMILILEILALEPLGNACEAAGSHLPTLPGAESEPLLETSMTPPARKRNKHNLPVLLDVHADRLTIWQSTASDEHLLLGDSQPAQPSADGQSQQRASSEPLKDFCVDVIVPFFSARLPELCDGINRKLGGPVIITPMQSKSARRSSGKREQRPGAAATKRPVPPTTDKRTLQRALSTEQMHRRSVSRGPSNAIALLRCATSTSLSSGLKREGSEPLPLKELPKGRENSPSGLGLGLGLDRSRHSSLSLLRSNSNSASTSASTSTSTRGNSQDIKANKKALLEAELKDAISALRKPNRGVVGMAMAEAEECRALASQSAKKAKRTTRSTLASSIQVKATPANNRFKDALAMKPESDADGALDSTEELIPPSSIGHLIPSTGHRHGHRDALGLAAMDFLEATPVRASTRRSFIKRMPDDELAAVPPSSPPLGQSNQPSRSHDDRGAPTRHTSSSASSSVGARTPSDEAEDLMATPSKRSVPRRQSLETRLPGGPCAQPSTVSIYDKLGWDNEFDDL